MGGVSGRILCCLVKAHPSAKDSFQTKLCKHYKVDKLCVDDPGMEGDAEGVRRDATRVYGGALRVRTIS